MIEFKDCRLQIVDSIEFSFQKEYTCAESKFHLAWALPRLKLMKSEQIF